jgi:outer membrane protein assembly factor BamE (lipoprotein component of BamABCDE complex)
MNMKFSAIRFPICAVLTLCAFLLVGCNHNPFGSKLTLANYNKITPGMSKAQVEQILGPPTNVETKDMVIFKKTTYRYENGKDFAIITFKNDEVDSKDTNLTTSS